MTKNQNSIAGAASVILAAFLLFYLPSMLTLFAHKEEPTDMIVLSLIMATFYTAIFCLNYLLLVPDMLFRRNKLTLFVITNFIIIIFLCSLLPLWFENHGGLPRPRHLQSAPLTAGQWVMGYLRFMIRDGIMMVLSVALAYAFRLSKARESMQRRMLELEAERRNLELISLKAQLNPHFLFNSLNNIYSLISIDPDKAQKSLHDLSSLLRFMIYDAEAATVPLEKELQFIREYVRLMALRLNSKVALSFTAPERETDGLFISPLLFLTIIENAFKHLDSSTPEPFISIEISLSQMSLSCIVTNSCRENVSTETRNEQTGVGLKNVERQLNLTYPNAFSLKCECEGKVYSVSLSISRNVLTGQTQCMTF